MDTLDGEKCGHCGVPAWHAFSDDNTITFDRKEVKCEACAFEAVDSKDEKLDPGVRKVVYAIPEKGYAKLPGRADWYAREHAKLLLKAEKLAEQAAAQAAEENAA